jgi:hypothetical protein
VTDELSFTKQKKTVSSGGYKRVGNAAPIYTVRILNPMSNILASSENHLPINTTSKV